MNNIQSCFFIDLEYELQILYNPTFQKVHYLVASLYTQCKFSTSQIKADLGKSVVLIASKKRKWETFLNTKSSRNWREENAFGLFSPPSSAFDSGKCMIKLTKTFLVRARSFFQMCILFPTLKNIVKNSRIMGLLYFQLIQKKRNLESSNYNFYHLWL